MDSQLSSKCTLCWMAAQAMRFSAVSNHTCSEQRPQKPLLASVFCDALEHALEHQTAECMFAAATEGHWLPLQGGNKIKFEHGIKCILVILSSVWAWLEFRLIFLEPCWLYSIRKGNLTVYNKARSYKSKYKKEFLFRNAIFSNLNVSLVVTVYFD